MGIEVNKYRALKEMILSNETLVVPDAFDGISARIIEFAGFKAVQCSGYSFSVSKRYADESMISLDENIKTTTEIVNAVNLPVFADGEDGYGSNELFEHNILKFVKTGIAGINIEDANIWSPFYKEYVVPESEMLMKIDIVNKVKKSEGIQDFILNARTDILSSIDNRQEGLKKAIERANLYLDSGADIAFITNVKTKDEIKLLNSEINGPISIAAGLAYNIDNYDINDCKELGVARVSLPSTLLLSSLKSQLDVISNINRNGSFAEIKSQLLDIETLHKLR